MQEVLPAVTADSGLSLSELACEITLDFMKTKEYIRPKIRKIDYIIP